MPGTTPTTRILIRLDKQRGSRQVRKRVGLVLAAFSLSFCLIGMRLVDLTMVRGTGFASAQAADAIPGLPADPVGRADILDRNGTVLARGLRAASLYADPTQVIDPALAAHRIAAVLPEISPDWIERRLRGPGRGVRIKRFLTPRQQAEVHGLGLAGLWFIPQERRVYPQGRAASHLLGYVDVDNRGIAGVEKALDHRLSGADGRPAPVSLAIDLRAQHVVEQELARALKRYRAQGAVGIVLDAHSGEIVASASLPDFDPNAPADAPARAKFPQATKGVYEMGSTFKVFTAAMALDSGAVQLTDRLDARKPLKVGRHKIRDFHAKSRFLSVPEVMAYSSNIGAALMAQAVGADRQRGYLRQLGLMDRPELELHEVGAPLWPDYWQEINTMTIGYGHGLSVSPLQLAAAMGAVVNGGFAVQPTVLRRDRLSRGERIFAAETSATMLQLLRLVVTEGTGKASDVPEYPVIGKTGTAEKVKDGRYSRSALVSSFLGAFPATNPAYVVLVMLDEPKGEEGTVGRATGGVVAAPVVANIVARIGPMLMVTPQDRHESDITLASFDVTGD